MRTVIIFVFVFVFVSCSDKNKEEQSISGRKKSSSRSVQIGSLGGEELTQKDFQIWNSSFVKNFRSVPFSQMEKIFQDYLRFKLISKIAEDEGFTEKSDVKMALSKMIFHMYMQNKMQAIYLKTKEENLGDEILLKFYNENINMFLLGERRRVSALILNDCGEVSSRSKSCHEKSLLIGQQLKHKPFFKLIEEFSEDKSSKQRLGDMGFLYHPLSSKSKLNRFSIAIVETIFKLEQVSSVSERICHRSKCYWFQITGILPSKVLSFQSQKSKIRSFLQRKLVKEKVDSFFKNLERKYNAFLNKKTLAETYKEIAK